MIPALVSGLRRSTVALNDATAVTGQTLADNLGNIWGINGAGVVTFNGAAQTYTAGVTALAWVNGQMWQVNASGGWYRFTVTNGVAADSGGGPFTNPLPVITGITLPGSQSFASGAPAGTVIGTLGVTATSGAFSSVLGSLSLAASATGAFAITGGNTLQTAAADPPGSYSVPVTATQRLLPGSPFTQTFTVTSASAESQAGTAVPGNAASINAAPVPGSPGFGSVITLTSGAQVAVNGTVLSGTAGAAALYYIGDSCFWGTGAGVWHGPVTTAGGGALLSNPAVPQPTVVLSNSTLPGPVASGTAIGTLSVTDGAGAYTWNYGLSGPNSANFVVSGVPVPPTGSTTLTNWYENPGQDGMFWKLPFQTTAQWLTSGSNITLLRQGSGHVHLVGDYSVPWYIGRATDPLVPVTAGGKTINVRIPVGAVTEAPYNIASDSSMGGADMTQPYLVWTVSGASINTTSIQATGSAITGTYGLQVDDGAGLILLDAITGQPGTNNSIGSIQDFELTAARADPNYVIPHMLAYAMDPAQMNGSVAAIWPLSVIDNSFPNSSGLAQGYTIGIPAATARPAGKSRGYYLLFDSLQQFGWFFYNVSGNGTLSLGCYSTLAANAALAQDVANSLAALMPLLCILSNQTGLSSMKGMVNGVRSDAFPAPPLLDLSPTGGVEVAPSSFGAYYPSGYNVTPTAQVS